MSQTTTEAVARIIDPKAFMDLDAFVFERWGGLSDGRRTSGAQIQSEWRAKAVAKAETILTHHTGEEFLEFKEALSDLRPLLDEYECLNGGGPNWSARNKAAWAKVDELFANEDEADYDRQQEDAHG